MNKEHITILLIESNFDDAAKIQTSLTQTMGSQCSVIHYTNPDEGRRFLEKENSQIDIVLLGLTSINEKNPKHVFRRINAAGGVETPVIVFTIRAEHELAKQAVLEGAADNVTWENLYRNPERVRDAIEFSLARNNLILEIHHEAQHALDQIKEEHANIVDVFTGGYSVKKDCI